MSAATGELYAEAVERARGTGAWDGSFSPAVSVREKSPSKFWTSSIASRA